MDKPQFPATTSKPKTDFGLGELKKAVPEMPKLDKEDEPDFGFAFTEEKIEQIVKDAEEASKADTTELNCMVLGADGTAKTGIVMDYCAKQPKKSMFIDLDGGALPPKVTYHKDNNNIAVLNPIQTKYGKTDVEIDYKATAATIKGVIKYIRDHHDDYSCIVLDGISTALKYMEYQMRLEKHLTVDGGTQYTYWKNRMKWFIEIIESIKAIPGVDKFYIGHEDFILDESSAAVKNKMNQMIHQRIICRRLDDELKGRVFVAKIDKSKYNLKAEGREIEFAIVKDGKASWDTSKIFEGLK